MGTQKMESITNWKCSEPCGKVMDNKKKWNQHLREEHSKDKLCSGFAPLYLGYISCDKWDKHLGKHEAINYQWEDSDSCAVCGEEKGANYEHWRESHIEKRDDSK